ncbi:MAG TPA: FHA domain-containing protein, partial [Anaerolineae bacterium]|nr:FHA domain-containing protein [Anaerolineae bacterium]
MTDAPQPPVQVEWKLIVDDGSNAVKFLPVTRDVLLIGRALTTDIPLDDPQISRHHARLTRQEDQLII